MEFSELVSKAKEVKEKYREMNRKQWGVAEYTQGFVGDVGDLVKLVMAKNEFRKGENIDEKLVHELSDCLWSILVIADELEIDIGSKFMEEMDELRKKIERGRK